MEYKQELEQVEAYRHLQEENPVGAHALKEKNDVFELARNEQLEEQKKITIGGFGSCFLRSVIKDAFPNTEKYNSSDTFLSSNFLQNSASEVEVSYSLDFLGWSSQQFCDIVIDKKYSLLPEIAQIYYNNRHIPCGFHSYYQHPDRLKELEIHILNSDLILFGPISDFRNISYYTGFPPPYTNCIYFFPYDSSGGKDIYLKPRLRISIGKVAVNYNRIMQWMFQINPSIKFVSIPFPFGLDYETKKKQNILKVQDTFNCPVFSRIKITKELMGKDGSPDHFADEIYTLYHKAVLQWYFTGKDVFFQHKELSIEEFKELVDG